MNLPSFNDVMTHKFHYLRDLIYNKDKALIYQYGPYLVMTNDINGVLQYVSYNECPQLRMMLDVGEIIKASRSNDTYRNVKKRIMNVLKELPKAQNVYSAATSRIGWDLISMIKEKQYETCSLESAILDYSPIVPYAGTLVKPDMEHHEILPNLNGTTVNTDQLDHMIDHYLLQNIVSILLNYMNFLSTDNNGSSYMLNEDEIASDVSFDVLKLCGTKKNDVDTYFSLVYLRYVVDPDNYDNILDYLIKLNMNYNKISKGEMVDVKEAMEAFERLSLPPLN